ncbi:MAG: transposase [Desulfurivibrionaceae bacterium]|jgi:putative transposase
MPRVARGLADGQFYHVLNRGNGRQQVFHNDMDYQSCLDLLDEAKERYPVTLFAYCLMPNHFHLLVQAGKGEALSRYMQWFMTSHVRRYHRRYGSSGHVWQGRFKSFLVQGDAHLLAVARYIEGNPVRAGLAERSRDWRWSSHGESCGRQKRNLTAMLPISFVEDWGEYVDQPMTAKEQEKIQRSRDRQAPFGTSEWQRKISREMGLESTLKPLGRPRKAQEK